MKCEILAVGTELLLGNIVNSNAQYISQKLAGVGVDVYYHHVVGDNFDRLVETFKKSLESSDVVITTGGLGPTDDDLTKEAICHAMGLNLVEDTYTIEKIKSFFIKMNRPMAECNLKQGMVPVGGMILENGNGTAPGLIIEKDKKIVILMPGPPNEMKPMLDNQVCPYLVTKSDNIIQSKTIKIVGVGESDVQDRLKDLFDAQTNPTVAPYAKESEVHLRVTAKAREVKEADILIEEIIKRIEKIFDYHIYGYDDDTLESVVVELLKKKNLKISLAESCTGGLASSRITDVPGASEVFLGGAVTYSNNAKSELLGVSEETLKKHGAVSAETAEEMAVGSRELFNSDIAVSVTGIAGPDGGSLEKPVGLSYIAFTDGRKNNVYKNIAFGARAKIKWYTSTRVLNIIRLHLLGIEAQN